MQISYLSMSSVLIPTLDRCVIDALDLFCSHPVDRLELSCFKRPLVVGSGNAAVTGRILFDDAVFADEGTYQSKLDAIPAIDGCILISASGAKHAPQIAQYVRKRKKPVILITTTNNAPAAAFCTKTYVFAKNTEPYTYNTSTYLGMILSKTGEDACAIRRYIQRFVVPKVGTMKRYKSYYLIVPQAFDQVRELFQTKFDELFGPQVNGRIYTPEQTKHAKTVVSSSQELFISFGYSNTQWGAHRLYIPLPSWAGHGMMMAVGYFVIGYIQQKHPAYFKRSIVPYTRQASALFKQTITPIVE